MKGLKLFALMTVVCCLAGTAWAADDANIFRADVFYSFPTGSTIVYGTEVEPDNAFGVDISYERRVTDVVGMQFGIGYASYDIKAKGNGLDEKVATLSSMPFYAGILFHPFPKSKVDWYIGPQIAFIDYGDLELKDNADLGGFQLAGGSDKASVDDPLTWAMRTGVDIMFGGGKLGINIDVQYYFAKAGNALKYYDQDGNYRTKDLPLDAYDLGVGVVWRF